MEERDRIIEMLAGGCTVPEVTKAYGRSDRCIRNLRTKYQQTGIRADKAWPGRPPVLSLQQKKIIYRKAHAAPKIEYSNLPNMEPLLHRMVPL
jgi:transposase